MKATDILADEHQVILQVLDCLEVLADRAEAGQFETAAAAKTVDFFRNFADRCHHAKEETHLFPAMEAKGFPAEGGPTGVMRHEHELGRGHVRAMAEAVEAAEAGQSAARQRFVAHAREYLNLLHQHIDKEDHCLFTMADQAFSAEDQQRLLETFQHVEAHEMGPGTHEKYLQLADELAAHCGVSRAATSRGHHCCGH